MIAFLTIMSIVLFAALIMCIRVLMRYARIIIELEDALSEALDVCDSAYGPVSYTHLTLPTNREV